MLCSYFQDVFIEVKCADENIVSLGLDSDRN